MLTTVFTCMLELVQENLHSGTSHNVYYVAGVDLDQKCEIFFFFFFFFFCCVLLA